MSTFDKVKEVIIDKLGVEDDKIESSSSFVDDLGAEFDARDVAVNGMIIIDRTCAARQHGNRADQNTRHDNDEQADDQIVEF